MKATSKPVSLPAGAVVKVTGKPSPGLAAAAAGPAPAVAPGAPVAAEAEPTPLEVVQQKIAIVDRSIGYLNARRDNPDRDPIGEDGPIAEQLDRFGTLHQRLNFQFAAVQANADSVARPTLQQIAQVLESVQKVETLNRNQAIFGAVMGVLNAAAAAAAPLAPKPSPGLSAGLAPAANPAARRYFVQSALPTVSGVSYGSIQKRSMTIGAAMDHRLQVAVARSRMGVPRAATSSAASEEIPVIAKVSDVSSWEDLSEVRIGATLGPTEDGHHVVTGRIPIQRIEAVRKYPCIASLKASQSVRPALASTTREMGIRPGQFPAGADPRGGAGVIVGVVDFGCDFAHQNFRQPNGATRLLALWDQAGAAAPGSPFGYGRLHLPAAINAALQLVDPYAALGYGPPPDTLFQTGTHGTHVMDIAGGNGRGSNVPGCAPAADLVFVEASTQRLPWSGPEAVGKSFGDSVQLLEAVRYIFDFAGNRPCVVNLSLGTNGGPHDGTTLVEQGLDALVRAQPNRMIVIAASNSGADEIHAQGVVPVGATAELVWNTPASEDGHELEVWLPHGSEVALELVAPDGTHFGPVEPGNNLSMVSGQQLVAYLSNRLNEPNNQDNSLGIVIAGGLDAGQWTVQMHSRGPTPASFHAWIERYDPAQSSFQNSNPASTVGSISCGKETIVVGSYDAHKATAPISYFTSRGPTRDGRQKPDISAPGHAVMAAHSRTGTGITQKSGTSMAAPAVTGLVALLMAEANRRQIPLTSAQIRDAVVRSARRNPPAGNAWEDRYGHGRASGGALGLI